MVQSDIASVLMNTNEFAENHTIRYDGEVYDSIPVILQKIMQSEKHFSQKFSQSSRMEGVFQVSAVAYIHESDLCGVIPEQGQLFEIDDGEALGEPFFRRYTVVTSKCEMGLITLELRHYDE